MIDKEKLKRRFSRNARQYDKYAKVQKNMGDILIEKIKSTKTQYKNILEIGCGTGYVTKALCEHFKNSNITAMTLPWHDKPQSLKFQIQGWVLFVVMWGNGLDKILILFYQCCIQWFIIRKHF